MVGPQVSLTPVDFSANLPPVLLMLDEYPWLAQAEAIKDGRSDRRMFLVVADTVAVGAMAIDFNRQPTELVFFEIQRKHRGRGIGRQAVLVLTEKLSQRNEEHLLIQTGRPSIYLGMGFQFETVGRSGILIATANPTRPLAGSSPDLVLIHAPEYTWHDTYDAPERPGRISTTIAHLETTDLMSRLKIVPPRYATFEELTSIHSPSYVQRVNEFSTRSEPLGINNPTCPDTYDIARLSFGGALLAGEKIEEWKRVFVLCRPPGHHATENQAMGFCFFNNMAGLALSLYNRGYRPMVIDWDAHHGNGTQTILYREPILVVSIHQKYLFPGTGEPDERGQGAGEGYNINIPVPPLTTDEDYLVQFRKIIPLAQWYRPDVILVSAGQDGHRNDKLSGLLLSSSTFQVMANLVRELAEQFAAGRIIALLEGGYNLQHLGQLNELVIRGLLG